MINSVFTIIRVFLYVFGVCKTVYQNLHKSFFAHGALVIPTNCDKKIHHGSRRTWAFKALLVEKMKNGELFSQNQKNANYIKYCYT
jgi:hypothetical protein